MRESSHERLHCNRPLCPSPARSTAEHFTIAWNSIEGAAALIAGILAGSSALVGFGLDSVIEVVSGAALLWRLRRDFDRPRREDSERIALPIVGVAL